MKNLLQISLWSLLICCLLVQCSKAPETPVTPKSSTKTLTSPAIDGIQGASSAFDATTATYTLTVPAGTDITALKLAFAVPSGATVKPISGSTQNFTNPVSYTVTAEDGSTQTYTVKVLVTAAPKSSEKQITAFTFAALSPVVSASIDQTSRKITATVPATVDLTSLVPTLLMSAKATVSPASGVIQNFTNPVSYTVTAEDGSKQSYEVKVEKAAVVTSNVPCLLTRIEDATNASEYMAFEYDINGQLVKIRATSKFSAYSTASFEYNANGEVTTRLIQTGADVFKDELSYTNGKLTSWKFYKNGLLQTGSVNVPSGDALVDGYFILNDKNEVIGIKNQAKFEYTNGNVTKYESYSDGKLIGTIQIDYDTKKHFLSATKPKGAFGYLYNVTLGNSTYFPGIIVSAFQNNPVKLTSSTGGTINYAYGYNLEGFPIESELTSTLIANKPKVKYTYSNCR